MKYLLLTLMMILSFTMLSCGDGTTNNPHPNTNPKMGQLGQDCYKDNSCDKGLICENNICKTDTQPNPCDACTDDQICKDNKCDLFR